MITLRHLLSACLLVLSLPVFSQKSFSDYLSYYPIGEDPDISYKTSYVAQETILFEANPIVRYSFYNNIVKGMLINKEHVQAWYIGVKPQLRMYIENSLPVKTPSYRVMLGAQQLYRLPDDRFWGFALESGHYSNGQSGCAFSEEFADGSQECKDLYSTFTDQTNLSDMLNRRSGNFSTNFTELVFNYRLNQLNDDFVPEKIHSFKLGTVLYHDRLLGIFGLGGFSDQDIAIYGRFRHQFAYEYSNTLTSGRRYAVADRLELITGAHAQINPWRNELSFTYYPILTQKEFGVFANYIYGHDNYNFRFVDSGHQLAIGIKWSVFPPFAIKSL